MTQITPPLESTAIIKNLRNHLAGRAVGISNDQALLEEILKIFFCVRLYPTHYRDQQELLIQAKRVREDFAKIKKDNPDLYENSDEVLLDPRSINYTVEALKALDVSSNKRKIDAVAHLYQAFIGNHIRGQEGQFFTPTVAIDFLVAAVDPQPDWKIIDTACGACSFLSTIYLHLLDNHPEEAAQKFVKSNMFGIEKDKGLSRLAKIHLTLLTKEAPQIINGDSLLVNKNKSSEHVEDNYFDLVITNPPFGSKIKAADPETSIHYDLGYKWEKEEKDYYEKCKEDYLKDFDFYSSDFGNLSTLFLFLILAVRLENLTLSRVSLFKRSELLINLSAIKYLTSNSEVLSYQRFKLR